jgi:transcription antitermination factor NusG
MNLNDQSIPNPTGSKWFAVYTRSRNEKKVATLLEERGIMVYLPLMKTLRQWSDRKRMVEVPLFNSYLFVHLEPNLVYKALQAEGAVYVVKFAGQPAVIPDEQIENLKIILGSSTKFELSFDEFTFGEHVEVVEGPLCGVHGVFVEYHGKKRVLIRMDAINQNLVIEVHPGVIKKKQVVDQMRS